MCGLNRRLVVSHLGGDRDPFLQFKDAAAVAIYLVQDVADTFLQLDGLLLVGLHALDLRQELFVVCAEHLRQPLDLTQTFLRVFQGDMVAVLVLQFGVDGPQGTLGVGFPVLGLLALLLRKLLQTLVT